MRPELERSKRYAVAGSPSGLGSMRNKASGVPARPDAASPCAEYRTKRETPSPKSLFVRLHAFQREATAYEKAEGEAVIVMPANSTGWIWHSLARETGRIGHLFSPGHERGPWPWFPYAFDNGCFSLWDAANNTFDEARWQSHGVAEWRRLMFWGQAVVQRPLWAIVPDRPGDWKTTVEKWSTYSDETPFPRAVAVQDGATPKAVRALKPAPFVIAVGGSTEWKWATVQEWIREFPRVHVLRVNAPDKLAWLEQLGAMSCDGTGWSRGDRKQTRGLEEWARSKSTPVNVPLWPHVCRAKRKAERGQMTFAA